MHHHYPFHPGRGVGGFFRILPFTIVGGAFLLGIFALLFAWPVEVLWNRLMPSLFGLKAITFWKAFGLLLLAKILFSGFGPYPRHHGPDAGRWHHHREHWRRFHGMHDLPEEEWRPGGSYKNWQYYQQYWRDEGKQAFEAYLDKKGFSGKTPA